MSCVSDIESYFSSFKPTRHYNSIFYLHVIICIERVVSLALLLSTQSY